MESMENKTDYKHFLEDVNVDELSWCEWSNCSTRLFLIKRWVKNELQFYSWWCMPEMHKIFLHRFFPPSSPKEVSLKASLLWGESRCRCSLLLHFTVFWLLCLLKSIIRSHSTKTPGRIPIPSLSNPSFLFPRKTFPPSVSHSSLPGPQRRLAPAASSRSHWSAKLPFLPHASCSPVQTTSNRNNNSPTSVSS